ncbi:MAG: type II secretion system F family protein, partial [Balneolales bacterium]|nr:type II secretion system F family protein [Balneolales bacterium]
MAGLPSTIAKKRTKAGTDSGLLSKEIRVPFIPEVPEKQVIEFTRNLAVMLGAKLTLLKAIETSIQQTTHTRFKTILTSIKTDVRKGKSFSQAITKYPKVFDGIYIQLSKVGELSGILDKVLLRLSGYKEKA